MKLGKREIDGLSCPPDRADILVFDDELKGFAVRVTRAGAKVFLFQYRRGAGVHRLRLGEYGDLTPAQARKLAERARGQVSEGRDPAGERKATVAAEAETKAATKRRSAADAYTVRAMLEDWERLSLAHRRPSYRREAVRALRLGLEPILDRPAHAVQRAELQRLLDAMTKTAGPRRRGPPVAEGTLPGQVIARRTRAYGHAMGAWAAKRGLIPANPFAGTIVEGRDAQRERVLSDAEIGEIWRAADELGWPWGPFFRFLLLTLQRETETAGLQWAELRPDFAAWELPGHRTKNGRPHLVHLAEPARAILRGVPRVPTPAEAEAQGPLSPSPLVFTTTGKTPISGFSHAKARLDEKIIAARVKEAAAFNIDPVPLASWRLHDFRRSGVTVMARLGVQVAVADKILNHAAGAIRGVAAIYQRHDFMAERQAALETWAGHVLSAAEVAKPASNVVKLRPG